MKEHSTSVVHYSYSINTEIYSSLNGHEAAGRINANAIFINNEMQQTDWH